MNELLFILIILICMFIIICTSKILEKMGLYMLLSIFLILNFILSFKITSILDYNININVVTYVSIFAIIFVLLTKYGEKEQKKILNITIVTTVLTIVISLISCLYIQTVNDTAATNLNNLFLSNYKIVIFYPITFLIEEYFWIKLYTKTYPLYESIFVTTISNCMLLGFVSTVIFSVGSYFTALSIKEIINIILTIYLFKIVITVSYTPLMYFSTKKVKK